MFMLPVCHPQRGSGADPRSEAGCQVSEIAASALIFVLTALSYERIWFLASVTLWTLGYWDRSYVCPSVSLFVCLSVCDALELWVNRGPDKSWVCLDCEENSAKIFATVFPKVGLLCRSGVKKITIFDHHLALSRKRHKIWPYLQCKTNRNFYAIYQMAQLLMSLSTRNLDFKVTIFFNVK